jgi:hypothetical protein
MKHSPLPRLRTHTIVHYPHRVRPRSILHGLRRRRSVWKRGLVSLGMSGLLVLFGAVLVTAVQPRAERRAVPQVVQHTRVVFVQDDTLPPVLQRIAQCESQGQHWAKDGKVKRGKRNPHDTGLFQINTVVWQKKAEALGYDLRTPEGNAQMARYLFAQYGSVPWQTSSACWNRTS